jgi:REP element-mobilizing transposase RayT
MTSEHPEALAPPNIADESAPTSAVAPWRGHRALRRYRVSLPNRTYFITACSHQRQRLFETDAVADLIFTALHALEARHHVATLIASVVMPDHVHAVFTLHPPASLATALKLFRGAAAQGVNRSLDRTGPVWQRGYFDHLLRANEPLEPLLHYLWRNPSRPGRHFRCRREIWTWFRTCVHDNPSYYEWLARHP